MKVEKDVSEIGIAQLCNEVPVCTVTMLYLTPKQMKNIFKFQAISDLFNSENLKLAIAQLCNELKVCNFTML